MGTPTSRDDAALRVLLASSYAMAEPAELELSARAASWIASVSSGAQRWWLRLERMAYRGVQQIELEAELATRLRSADCSVPAPVRRTDTSFASTLAIEGECSPAFSMRKRPACP
jgi:Ser/Thr protein kinase RdoA (MazF antagonist)